ncbi:MAG: hypothetical protein JXB88_22310 [Spirochaetales bacterium]|nr:hypothetical protein [Spirochaetales bacterium]
MKRKFDFDNELPVITISKKDFNNDFYFLLDITVTDKISKVESIEYSIDGGTVWKPYTTNPHLFEKLQVKQGIIIQAIDYAGNRQTYNINDIAENAGG